ncbi:MAG: helix-turn-helix domain-containing protein [Phocaeicola sp.]
MEATLNKLKAHASTTPSSWREEAEFRQENKTWLRYSQMVAMKMLDRMEELSLTQKTLAEKMNCSQQYISKVLKGRENLSLETLFKIENALNLKLVCEPEFA